MNKVILTGNVTAKYDNETNVRITIADNFKTGTSFIPITLFDQKADFVRKFVNIGDHIYVEGALSSTESQDEGGKKKNKLFVQCWSIGFEGFRNPNKDKNPSYSAENTSATVPAPDNGFIDISSVSADGELLGLQAL